MIVRFIRGVCCYKDSESTASERITAGIGEWPTLRIGRRLVNQRLKDPTREARAFWHVSCQANGDLIMRTFAIALGILMLPGGLPAQDILSDHPILLNGDMAVLEAGEPRKDLECSVIPDKGLLGFDLAFHTGYTVMVPIK